MAALRVLGCLALMIAYVNAGCKMSVEGREYAGRIDVTKSGLPCLSWTSDYVKTKTGVRDVHFTNMGQDIEEAKNYCRNPTNFPQGPWCFTGDEEKPWDYCDIPICTKPGCKDTVGGREYTGHQSQTQNGYLCQAWDKQEPHEHDVNPKDLPDDTLTDARNFCRNPDGAARPWCYTTNPKKRWEYCDVRLCTTTGCLETDKGEDYYGNLTVTESGRTCQAWTAQKPHAHSFTDGFPDGDPADAFNYCRNPGGVMPRPFCLTTDPAKRWEYCDIPKCGLRGCTETSQGVIYMGKRAMTVNNRTCQYWNKQTPHAHGSFTFYGDESVDEVKNYCRNPNGLSRPWCYTTDPAVRWEYCDIPMCGVKGCKVDDIGYRYNGTRQTTVSGRLCQKWSDAVPHEHGFLDVHFTNMGTSLAEVDNHCRNPNKAAGGPWCYTEDPSKTWEYCDVPKCGIVGCRESVKAAEYQGHQAVTESGINCQRWDAQFPHKHAYSESINFPDGSATEAQNYCRNPNGSERPWCFTTDDTKRWEYCDIPMCNTIGCREVQGKGEKYKGQLAVTESGIPCQPWTQQWPHVHNWDKEKFPDGSAEEAQNFCRNPGGKMPRPFCMTMDEMKRWEYCDVPSCGLPACKETVKGREYRGDRAVTRSGRTCQFWNRQVPHAHAMTDFPEGIDSARNYCRNPGGVLDGPWCYTTDPDKRWEYCDLPFCGLPECLEGGRGTDYDGKRAVTQSGFTCRRWDSKYPHPLPFKSAHFELWGQTIEEAENFCRNPNNVAGGPWCYTSNPEKPWDYCGIQQCGFKGCKETVRGAEYTGHRSVTVTKRRCQPWASQSPHAHEMYDFEGGEEAAGNYCRNPDNKPLGPWCYTTDPSVRWEYCDIPPCNRGCRDTEAAEDYAGNLTTTVSGRTCQKWNSQKPHKHEWTEKTFIDGSVRAAENYCRNPEGLQPKPWCFTTDPDKRWEFCEIPLGDECKPAHREYLDYKVPPSARILEEEGGDRGDKDVTPANARDGEEEQSVKKADKDCTHQIAAFRKNQFPDVTPSFAEDCNFHPKQCSRTVCFCVHAKKGTPNYGGFQVPLNHDFDCSRAPEQCERKLFGILISGRRPAYLPTCTSQGFYERMQCRMNTDNNVKECWCVNKHGHEIRNTLQTGEVKC